MSAHSCNITDQDFMNNPERVANSKQLIPSYKRGAGEFQMLHQHPIFCHFYFCAFTIVPDIYGQHKNIRISLFIFTSFNIICDFQHANRRFLSYLLIIFFLTANSLFIR
jgi:hypothetical protein